MDRIRLLTPSEYTTALDIINAAAEAYRGIIPPDCWHEPYMSESDLAGELADGVQLWGAASGDEIVGVMCIQPKHDAFLIRHAYVRPQVQGRGIGARLLDHLRSQVDAPILIGTWAAASWAIRFYERNGFQLVPPDRTVELLRKYWSIPDRQLRTSVVLTDGKYRP